jgi:hypothetical protein
MNNYLVVEYARATRALIKCQMLVDEGDNPVRAFAEYCRKTGYSERIGDKDGIAFLNPKTQMILMFVKVDTSDIIYEGFVAINNIINTQPLVEALLARQEAHPGAASENS